MNDRRWPWLVLVPMREGAVELHDLPPLDQPCRIRGHLAAGAALKSATGALKINTGALGNIVRQLHIHVVARTEGDPNWPASRLGLRRARTLWRDGTRSAWRAHPRPAVWSERQVMKRILRTGAARTQRPDRLCAEPPGPRQREPRRRHARQGARRSRRAWHLFAGGKALVRKGDDPGATLTARRSAAILADTSRAVLLGADGDGAAPCRSGGDRGRTRRALPAP